MAPSPIVFADTHEPAAVVGSLFELGIAVERRSLAAGDYVIGEHAIVERKAVLDLHASLRDARLWTQVDKLRRAGARPFLLIEGARLESGPMRANAIKGALLSIADLGVVVISSADIKDSASWLAVIARRRPEGRDRDRPVYAQRRKRPQPEAKEAVLAAVPGVSVVVARNLIKRFGSVKAMLDADPESWHEVPQVGRVRAEALRAALLH